MSLHKFADMVAKQGRGDDSLLIHMTPDEVQRLQAFAQANGRSLTINPETGLPEAGMLSDLFKAVAPIALGAFLGPGAFGIAGMGLSAGTAGLITGGITSLATGSLSRGLMAGLGAYGGAGLAEGLANAGTGAGLSEALAGSATGTGPQVFGDVAAAQGSSGQAFNEFLKSNANPATMSGFDATSAGLKAAAADPMSFAKQNFGNIAAAAAPIMAGAMVPTTTKMPENTNPAYIRQKLYDPYTQTYKSLTPVKASEWGSRSFSDAYTNPQTGEMATLHPRAPSGFAGGGIVALAAGGTAPTILNDEELYQKTGSWEAAAAARDEQNKALNEYNWNQQAAAAAPTPAYFVQNPDVAKAFTENSYGMSPEDFAKTHYEKFGQAEGRSLPSAGADYAATHNVDVGANVNKWIQDNPFATAEDVKEAIAGAGMTQADINPYLTANTNISDAARYALSHDMGLAGLQQGVLAALKANPNATQAQIDAEQAKYGLSNADIQSPLTHGYQVANDQSAAAIKYLQDNPDVARWVSSAEGKDYIKQHPEFDAQDIAFTHYKRYGEKEGRKWGLDKKSTTFVNPVTGGTINPPTRTTTTVLPTDPTVNAPPGTKNPYGGPNTPGDKTYNPDGSITVTPNIPGRPYGGFSGMDEVKNAYTAGGGSLGYIPKAPKTIAEFDAMYNQQTGDSLAAYNYLMGKGGAKFPIQSVAASTGINRPYWTGAMRYKPKFLTANKDGTVTTSETNPNAPSANVGSVAEAKTINVVNNRGETEIATLGPDGKYRTAGGETYDSSGAIVMAQGGISGDGNLNLHIPLDFGGGGGGGQSGIGDYGAGTPIPMMGTLGASNGSVNPNDSIGGYGSPYRPDERGGLYKGPMGIPAGLDDSGMGSPEILARAKANDAARASASTSPVSLDALAKALGGGMFANGGVTGYAMGGGLGSLGSYSDGGRLLKGPGDGVSDSIPATIGAKRQPARLADGEFVIPARIVSELGNGSTEAGARKLYAMMDRVQKARSKTTGKNKVAANTRADKHLPA